MKIHRRHTMLILATAAALCLVTPLAQAGGSFGIHLGSGGFGVSVGFGDWGVYTRSWSDPYWSLDFNSSLAGYGQWVWVNGLGRVWRPWVSVGWRPYTYGRWVATGVNWTWVAYEPWGYIPHHYGTWAYSNFGWVWQPGYSYYHANVVWARSGSYVGWYARPPHGWSHATHGFRHGYRHGYQNGYSDGWHDARYGTYVDWRHFGSDNVSHHAVTHTMATRGRLENNAAQPSAAELRRRGGVSMAQTQLSRRTVRMGDREVTIVRPEGVARSIERNAADAAAGALARAALERRQPLVRSRSAGTTSAASPSRRVSSDRQEARNQPARTRRPSVSSSRSGSSASAAFPRTVERSDTGVERTHSTSSNVVARRPADRGQDVREVPRNRGTTESRSSTSRSTHRSDRATSAPTSPQMRRSATQPDTTAARRVPQKPRTTETAKDRTSNSTDRKRPRRQSAGASKR